MHNKLFYAGPEKKKKKTDLLSYEDWLASRFGRKRAAALEHDTPSKRRKRDVADYRTPRYVEIDLCLTGDCDKVPTRMLRVKPKRQFKKGVVRSLNLGGTVSSSAQRLHNWLKQANEIPFSLSEVSTSRDHSSVRKYQDLMGKNVGSNISNGVIVQTQYGDADPDVCVIDDSDAENGATKNPIQRPLFSIFQSRPQIPKTSSAPQNKPFDCPGTSQSSWNMFSSGESPAPSCSKVVTLWNPTFISDEEKENNKMKLKEKLAKYLYNPRTNDDENNSNSDGIDEVTADGNNQVAQFSCPPKKSEHNTDTDDSGRKVSILGDTTRITINTKDYVTNLGRTDASPRKCQFQVHTVGMN